MSELKQSGHYTLESFKIIKSDKSNEVDVRLLIHTFNIIESMSAGAIRGSAVIYDSNDLINTFPLRSEEFIEITYSDFFDVSRTEQFFLYSITDVGYAKEESQAIVKYTINFVSVPKLFSENVRVAKTYKPDPALGQSLISDYVNTAYTDYYSDPIKQAGYNVKEIVIEPTTGDQSFVIPRMTPEQTMHFFARKAYANGNKSQSFRFFETRDKFYFATNEYMQNINATGGVGYGSSGSISAIDPGLAAAAGKTAKAIRVFRRNYATDRSPERQTAAMYELLDLDFGIKNDTIDDINSGAYKRAAYEVDLINGTLQKFAYDLVSEFNEDKLKLPHEESFINERITKERETFIIKDYASVGVQGGTNVRYNMFYPDIYNRKTVYFYHYEKNKVRAKIYGRNDLFAGDIIELDLVAQAKGDGTQERDVERSGPYIVESVENKFHENIYTQNLILSRSGIGA